MFTIVHMEHVTPMNCPCLDTTSTTIKQFMSDVFGQTTEGVHKAGLVDALYQKRHLTRN